jgi:hypothetical protein
MRGVGAGQIVEPVAARGGLLYQVGVKEPVERPVRVLRRAVQQGGRGVRVEIQAGMQP